MDPITYPAFTAYAITCLVLCANLFFLWGRSGAVRNKTKVVINPEDSAGAGKSFHEFDPPDVGRILRAHTNASANIYPFLFLGLVFVLAGGSARVGAIIFGWFVAARWMHTVMYLKGVQPWRTVSFALGALGSVAPMIAVIVRLV